MAWRTLALETKDLCDSFPIDVKPPLPCVWAMSSIFFCVCTTDLKPGSLIWFGNQQPERWRAVSVLVTHLQCAACLSFTFSAILLVNHCSYYQSLACVVFVLGWQTTEKGGTIEKLKLLSLFIGLSFIATHHSFSAVVVRMLSCPGCFKACWLQSLSFHQFISALYSIVFIPKDPFSSLN